MNGLRDGGGNLLVRGIGHLVTMDPAGSRRRGAWIRISAGMIAQIGEGEPRPLPGEDVLDAAGGIVLPGLVNTHHHMQQNLARAYPPVANLPLLEWVGPMNLLWERLTPEDTGLATRVAMAELMLSGCTTTIDQHYIFPPGAKGMIEAQFSAAETMGMRFHAGRGSIDLPSPILPDWIVEQTGEILTHTAALIERYHDTSPGSFRQIAIAPCGPLICSPELLRESARLSEIHRAALTTHCNESRDEIGWGQRTVGRAPFDHLLHVGWESERVLLAHSIHLSDENVRQCGRHRFGIAHCPGSNMRLGSGICRAQDLRKAGARVGLGVDGSSSNDSGHLLNEVRLALYLARAAFGAGSIAVEDVLSMATVEGAACLGRSADLGSIEVGKCGDLAIFPEEDLYSSGAGSPVDGLIFCFPRSVRNLVIGGRVRVKGGHLEGIDLPRLIEDHARAARRYTG